MVCDDVVYHIDTVTGRKALPLPAVLSSAWFCPAGGRALVLVNPEKTDAVCRVEEATVTVPALGARLLRLD